MSKDQEQPVLYETLTLLPNVDEHQKVKQRLICFIGSWYTGKRSESLINDHMDRNVNALQEQVRPDE